MTTGRSFAEFIKNKCYNGLYPAAEDYVNENWKSMNLYVRNGHRIGFAEMLDGTCGMGNFLINTNNNRIVKAECGNAIYGGERMMTESQNIEWKESWRDEYLKWICGFANA